MLTPKQLQEETFDKAVFGGYDMKQVDDFLETLTSDYTNLYKENSVLKSKMKILVEKLEEYRSQDSNLKKTLVAAQNTAEGIIAEAQKQATKILNDAESVVSAKVADCHVEIDAEQARVAEAQKSALEFIAAIEAEVHAQAEKLQALRSMAAEELVLAPAAEEAPVEEAAEEAVEEAPVEEAPAAEPVPEFNLEKDLLDDESGEEQMTFGDDFKLVEL